MNLRFILALAFIFSMALPLQSAGSAQQPASTATVADKERLLAAERARLEAARAELAAKTADVAALPDGAPTDPPAANSSKPAPAAAAGTQPQTQPSTVGRPPAQPPVAFGAPAPSAGSLLQTILALTFVLALLAGLAWFMKRFGAKAIGGSANLRIVGSLNLGGRERLMVVEVGDQWIVVGASPGRVNALATMPKQEGVEQSAALAGHMPAASSFGEWLKQTIDKRNGK